MLIVAMPKSASSSLARTLARAHGLDEWNQDINESYPPQFPEAHRLLQTFHPFPGVPTDDLRAMAEDAAALRKLHLFPTDEVRRAITGRPVVVLVRDAAEIVDAEFRGVVSGVHPLAPSMPRTVSLERWREAARRGGLLDSLQELHHGWTELAARTDELLLVTYRELVDDSSRTLAACAAHLGLPPSGHLELLRERYSGGVASPSAAEPAPLWRTLPFVLGTFARRVQRAVVRRLARRMPAR